MDSGGPCFGISKALFDCLFPLGTGPKLFVEDMGLEEKFQPLLRIEACTGRLNLEHGADRRHVNFKLVRSSQELRARQPSSGSDEVHEITSLASLREKCTMDCLRGVCLLGNVGTRVGDLSEALRPPACRLHAGCSLLPHRRFIGFRWSTR